MTDPEITQADREAAARFLEANHANARAQAYHIRRGQRDDDRLVQTFARHRMLGRAEGAAQERAEIAQHILIAVGYFRDDMSPGAVKFFQDLADGLGNSGIKRGEYKRSE